MVNNTASYHAVSAVIRHLYRVNVFEIIRPPKVTFSTHVYRTKCTTDPYLNYMTKSEINEGVYHCATKAFNGMCFN